MQLSLVFMEGIRGEKQQHLSYLSKILYHKVLNVINEMARETIKFWPLPGTVLPTVQTKKAAGKKFWLLLLMYFMI